MDGFFLIDKEKGMTSFDVIREVRRIIDQKKVGHSGTLDKNATGLLIVAVGKATKELTKLIGFDKEYLFSAKFGYVSDTYDALGAIEKTDFEGKISESKVQEAMQEFQGEISQKPPKYSALKVGGRRASDIVRSGGKVELKPRKVRIDLFEIIKYDWPLVDFRVKCSSGTYIRSLVNDLGEKLGCGGYVTELRRTKIGNFCVEDACLLAELNKKIEQRFVPLSDFKYS